MILEIFSIHHRFCTKSLGGGWAWCLGNRKELNYLYV